MVAKAFECVNLWASSVKVFVVFFMFSSHKRGKKSLTHTNTHTHWGVCVHQGLLGSSGCLVQSVV